MTSKIYAFQDLGEDVFLEIISLLDAVSISLFLSTSKYFWQYRWKIGTASKIVPYQECIQAKNWNEGLRVAVENNHFLQILWFINKGANSWNDGLKACIQSEHLHLMEFFINLGADVKCGINEASFHGDLIVVEHLISTYNVDITDWDTLMMNAAMNGHSEFVESLYQRAKQMSGRSQKCLEALAAIGNQELFDECVKAVSNPTLGPTLYWASYGGHVKLIYAITKRLSGPPPILTLASQAEHGLGGASRGGRKNIALGFLKNMIDKPHKAIVEAALGKQFEMINLLVQHGGKVHIAVEIALELKNTNKMEAVYFLIDHPSANLDMILKTAAHMGMNSLVDKLIEKGAKDFTLALHYACRGRHYDLMDFFIQKGADINKVAKELAKEGNSEILEYFAIHGLGEFTAEINEANKYKPIPIAKVSNSTLSNSNC